MGVEAALVAEEREADVPVGDDVDAVEVVGGGAVEDEAAQVPAEEAADVEEGAAGLEEGEDTGVGGRAAQEGVEPCAEAGAGVGADGPGTVALWEVSMC